MNDSSSSHLSDLAEEYALGSLSQTQAAQFQKHVTVCEECRDRVRAAEEAVTAMIEAGELCEAPAALHRRIVGSFARRATPPWSAWSALAAALVLWIVPAGWFYAQNRQAANTIAGQSVAIRALVHSHFAHAPFAATAPGAPAAKVVFARTGEWLYVIIAAPADGLQVGTMTGNGVRIWGRPSDVNGSSEFYTASGERVNNVVIVRAGRVIARAPVAQTAKRAGAY